MVRWQTDGPMVKYARGILESNIFSQDTSPKKLYESYINALGIIKYETFRRQWHRIKQHYLNETAESIQLPFELHPPGYDPS